MDKQHLMKSNKIVIIDESIIFAKGLSVVINSHFSDYHIYIFYHTINFEKVISSISPFLVIVNTNFINNNNIDATINILEKLTESIKIHSLLIVNPKNKILIKRLLKNKKHSLISVLDDDEYLKCLQVIKNDGVYISKSLNENNENNLNKDCNNINFLLNTLSQKEQILIKLILNNFDSKKISDVIGIKVKSVEKSRSRICEKLELPGINNSLTRWVFENKNDLNNYFSA
jgi:DNA-binding NarL/FixJ family response regulator